MQPEQRDVTALRFGYVYCGNFVGAPRWHGLEVYEPYECNYEGRIELGDPEEDDLVTWVCPGCGAINTFRDHEVTDV